jgi:uncharacterized protein involved in outer membrane biogenesis
MMREDEQQRRRTMPKWWWFFLAAVVALLAILFVPPFLSVSRYKAQITNLVAHSLGRPVRLSSVSVRLLPRPGFVLTDLVVDDDSAFGAEPVIHANSVTTPIGIWSLWRGRLEISEISVDEASLNLVRTADGRWNLDSLLETPAANAGKMSADVHRVPFPRLVASNSRINFKTGVEKLPFSLIDTDLTLWQSNPGEWRLRLRGQPARTDVSISSGDTGIVDIEATAKQAADLRQMPIHVDVEWREAQLGQLTRLMTGSDAGWRGDLRGEAHLEGTAENAQIKTRLRATGVHRAEFAPPEPMDFDANCSLVYHRTSRTIENLLCDSPIGEGRIRATGQMNGDGHLPQYSVEMDRVPVAAGLEALRTVRSGVDPNLTAAGAISGKVSYDESVAAASTPKKALGTENRATIHAAKAAAANLGSLAGSFTVEGFQLSGGGLSKPLVAQKVVIAPTVAAQGQTQALAGTFTIPAGAPVPLTLDLRFAFHSYQLGMRGQVGVQSARELAHVFGLPHASELNDLAGDPLAVDLNAQGPWLPAEDTFTSEGQPAATAAGIAQGIVRTTGASGVVDPVADSLTGTVMLRNANWKADYLANHVEISDATLHLNNGEMRWDPINFVYGPLKGSATLAVPKACDSREPCPAQSLPRVDVRFSRLDAATVQTAILGAREEGTVLSDLLNRLRPSAAPEWPRMQSTVTADSLVLGPATLQSAKAQLHIAPTGIEITALDGKLLGGALHATGTLVTGDKPDYTISADLQNLSPVAAGQLLSQNWRGGTLDASGKVELAGYTGSDLADSAKGTLHFEWRRGAATGAGLPPALNRFDRWTADATIADGKVTFGQNELVQGSNKQAVAASVVLAEPVKLSFGTAETTKSGKATTAEKP